MERVARLRCRGGVKALGAVALAAAVVASPAAAKIGLTVTATDRTPAVRQRVTLTVRSERKLDSNLRLIAVAPGQPIFHVVATITGDTSYPDPNVADHGFEIRLRRVAANRWRGVTTFPRGGRWRVVVPNFGPVGVVMPNGAARLVLSVH